MYQNDYIFLGEEIPISPRETEITFWIALIKYNRAKLNSMLFSFIILIMKTYNKK